MERTRAIRVCRRRHSLRWSPLSRCVGSEPPAIHLTYRSCANSATRCRRARDDLVAAAVIAMLLWQLGTAIAGGSVGPWSAVVFLFLSNPAFARLGGVSVRAQCETFIAASVTAAFLCLARSRHMPRPAVWCAAAGALFGLAFAFKYNAIAYVPAGIFALFVWKRLAPETLVGLAAGFLVGVSVRVVVCVRARRARFVRRDHHV